jgi:ubiquinone/menaquinone biosynthesis C-methylase UbiE
MMAYARTQAKSQGLDDRVEFKTMDALRILEFPPSSFDLVNQRLGFSWLRTWEWAKLLQEYQRVSRPGGIIRITEPSITATYEHSPALTKLNDIALETCYRSGRLFVNSADGVMCEVVRLMTQHEIRDVQSRVHTLVYQAGTAELQHFCDDMTLFYRVGLPYFQKWTNVPSDYQDLYQQALKEMQQPDFVVTSTVLTAWGKSPPKKERTSQTV